jgi:type IV secretory pathway VirB10-like protein
MHAYAECLDVDAELMIEDFLEERGGALGAPDEVSDKAPVASAAEAVPAAILTSAQPRSRSALGVAALIVVAIVMLATWGIMSRDDRAVAPSAPAATAPIESQVLSSRTLADVAPTPAEPPPAESVSAPVNPPAPRSEPSAPEPARARPAPETRAPSALRIPDHGVGAGVENRELVGRGGPFSSGTRAHFWTRVQGGAPGDRIEHVWLREGVETARISLEIGGSNWRTYSVQTLAAAGEWAVEARDDAGRVLARAEFVCVP